MNKPQQQQTAIDVASSARTQFIREEEEGGKQATITLEKIRKTVVGSLWPSAPQMQKKKKELKQEDERE